MRLIRFLLLLGVPGCRTTGRQREVQGRHGHAASAQTGIRSHRHIRRSVMISGREPRDRSRFSFSATLLAPISVRCTWRTSVWRSRNCPRGSADQVKLVFVTTDPARDTPLVLRRWLDHFDQHFVGLTGTEAALDGGSEGRGCSSCPQRTERGNGNYSVAHANFVIAYTKDNLAHVIYPGGVSKDDWVHDLPLLINETWSRP